MYVPICPPLIVESIEVRFLRRRADSSCCSVIEFEFGLRYLSASSSQRSKIGFNLHIFLKLKILFNFSPKRTTIRIVSCGGGDRFNFQRVA